MRLVGSKRGPPGAPEEPLPKKARAAMVQALRVQARMDLSVVCSPARGEAGEESPEPAWGVVDCATLDVGDPLLPGRFRSRMCLRRSETVSLPCFSSVLDQLSSSCGQFRELQLSVDGFSVSKWAVLADMLGACRSLETLVMTGFDTEQQEIVRACAHALRAVPSLRKLELRGSPCSFAALLDTECLMEVPFLWFSVRGAARLRRPSSEQRGWREDGRFQANLWALLAHGEGLEQLTLEGFTWPGAVQEGLKRQCDERHVMLQWLPKYEGWATVSAGASCSRADFERDLRDALEDPDLARLCIDISSLSFTPWSILASVLPGKQVGELQLNGLRSHKWQVPSSVAEVLLTCCRKSLVFGQGWFNAYGELLDAIAKSSDLGPPRIRLSAHLPSEDISSMHPPRSCLYNVQTGRAPQGIQQRKELVSKLGSAIIRAPWLEELEIADCPFIWDQLEALVSAAESSNCRLSITLSDEDVRNGYEIDETFLARMTALRSRRR